MVFYYQANYFIVLKKLSLPKNENFLIRSSKLYVMFILFEYNCLPWSTYIKCDLSKIRGCKLRKSWTYIAELDQAEHLLLKKLIKNNYIYLSAVLMSITLKTAYEFWTVKNRLWCALLTCIRWTKIIECFLKKKTYFQLK